MANAQRRLINRERNQREYYKSWTPNDGHKDYTIRNRSGGADYILHVYTQSFFFPQGYFGPPADVSAKVPAVGHHRHKESGAPRFRAYHTPHKVDSAHRNH